jgi:hypothetical protein
MKNLLVKEGGRGCVGKRGVPVLCRSTPPGPARDAINRVPTYDDVSYLLQCY